MDLKFRKKYSSIDSCIILRTLQGNVPAQKKKAVEFLLSGGDFYVDEVVIMETVYVLTKDHTPRQKIVDDLRTFLSNSMIQYNASFFEPVFDNYLSHPSLSFDDCVIEARISAKGYTPLWTFDKKFAHQTTTARLLA